VHLLVVRPSLRWLLPELLNKSAISRALWLFSDAGGGPGGWHIGLSYLRGQPGMPESLGWHQNRLSTGQLPASSIRIRHIVTVTRRYKLKLEALTRLCF